MATNLLCNCYKDLCMIIRGVTKSPVPSMAVNARWLVKINEDDCTACEACIPRCQMDALKMADGKLTRDEKRCIGCGICMWVCPDRSAQARGQAGQQDTAQSIASTRYYSKERSEKWLNAIYDKLAAALNARRYSCTRH